MEEYPSLLCHVSNHGDCKLHGADLHVQFPYGAVEMSHQGFGTACQTPSIRGHIIRKRHPHYCHAQTDMPCQNAHFMRPAIAAIHITKVTNLCHQESASGKDSLREEASELFSHPSRCDQEVQGYGDQDVRSRVSVVIGFSVVCCRHYDIVVAKVTTELFDRTSMPSLVKNLIKTRQKVVIDPLLSFILPPLPRSMPKTTYEHGTL